MYESMQRSVHLSRCVSSIILFFKNIFSHAYKLLLSILIYYVYICELGAKPHFRFRGVEYGRVSPTCPTWLTTRLLTNNDRQTFCTY